MEKSYRKNRNKGQSKREFTRQGKSRSRKKGRRTEAISGFSTLSQVSGAPLARDYHSSISVLPPRIVKEPYDTCAICGEKIDSISSAFAYGAGYAHFDCVLSSLKEREHLEDNETMSYLGSGSFGICRKDDDGKFTIVKKIEVENKDSYQNFKNYVESLKE